MSGVIYPTIIAPGPRDAGVLIGTGTSEALLEGRLSSTPSFKKSVGSGAFLELWTVICQTGNFCKSDGPMLPILLSDVHR
jgi:hypothetical protein